MKTVNELNRTFPNPIFPNPIFLNLINIAEREANMPQFNLISFDLCPYVQRSIITLLEKDIEHERTYIDLKNKPDWFLDISPTGKVPVLKVSDQGPVFESAVICEYLDEITPGSLHPKASFEKARHRSWIEFGSGILNSIGGFYSALDLEQFQKKQQELKQKMERVEDVIVGPYFAGSDFHMVDAVYATVFRYFNVIDRISDFGIFEHTPKLKVWRSTLNQRKSVKEGVLDTYETRLLEFFQNKNSYLSTLIAQY